jgi:capsular polysaccharide biosynthesis protein
MTPDAREDRARMQRERIRALTLGPRPQFYALQKFKAALVARRGPAAAASAWGALSPFDGARRTDTLELVPLLDHVRGTGAPRVGFAAPRDVVLPGPRLADGTTMPSLPTRTRAFFHCRLADAVVASKSNFLIAGDRALLDLQPGEAEKVALDLDVDPLVVARDGERLTTVRAAAEAALPTAFSLIGLHSAAFGHWLVEFLPRLWACRPLPGFAAVPVLVDAQMPPQHREALDAFLLPGQAVIELAPGDAVRVADLWLATAPLYMPTGPRPGAPCAPDLLAVDAEAFARTLRAASAERPVDGAHGRRLYLARKDTQHRRLLNRVEVEAWMAAHAFDLVDFADIPFAEQVARMRAADIVVGPDGSANLMTYFARPGTRIGILSGAAVEDCEWYVAISDALGHRVVVLPGETPSERDDYRTFSDYRIDLDRLAAMCRDLGVAGA